MNLNEYQELACRTLGSSDLAVLGLGLAGEAGELLEVVGDKEKSIKELGDVTWYMATLAHKIEMKLGDVALRTSAVLAARPPVNGLVISSSKVADHIKKVVGHGHALDKDLVVYRLAEILVYCDMFAEQHGFELELALQKNIDKLRARYPQGFSSEASINRKD